MSTYHLDARLFEGTLDRPRRNELRTGESDQYDELAESAEQLAGQGYTVWVYRHDPHRLGVGPGPYRVIREWRPGPIT